MWPLQDKISLLLHRNSDQLHIQSQQQTLKSVRIRSFAGLHFPVFALNTGRYGVFPHIQSECGKMRTRKTPETNIFHAVKNSRLHCLKIIQI